MEEKNDITTSKPIVFGEHIQPDVTGSKNPGNFVVQFWSNERVAIQSRKI